MISGHTRPINCCPTSMSQTHDMYITACVCFEALSVFTGRASACCSRRAEQSLSIVHSSQSIQLLLAEPVIPHGRCSCCPDHYETQGFAECVLQAVLQVALQQLLPLSAGTNPSSQSDGSRCHLKPHEQKDHLLGVCTVLTPWALLQVTTAASIRASDAMTRI